ncbi:pyrimidine (deoxy)nucleoside triphosphate diphosphatase [Raoultella sp. T31]|uniref:pyrimidine (deoxy)nucleoside triphosphate diphosphatase n=1 Tax=Raoultella sp. T31 TaxID=2054594 RepID=UPI000C28CC56|nr:NTP pyrophosphohydrolase [Raoultella sp. T31]
MQKTLDVVAAIIEQDGKILLAQRPSHADQPGLWEFAGGKVEPGESQPQALIRELQEELGITAQVERYIASHQREVSGRLIHLHAWWVARFSGLPSAHYHRQLRWCTLQEALTFDLAPADIPLLNAFIAQRAAGLPR